MLCLTPRVNLWRGDTVHQAQDVKSAFMRAIPARRGAARSWVRSALALVVLALMAVARTVPAQTAHRDTVRQTCAIRVAQTRPGHATRPAIIRVSVTDSTGKPIESASVNYSGTAASGMTDGYGLAVLSVPASNTLLGTRLGVRRADYTALLAPLAVAAGDTVTATAVLCPSRTVIEMMITTSTGTHLLSREHGDTMRACAPVAEVRWDTTGRTSPTPGDAIVRGHMADSAGAPVTKGSIAVHPGTPDHVRAAIAGGFADQHGDVAVTVRASQLGRGAAMVLALRGLAFTPISLPVQLAPGDRLTIRAALCPGKDWLSQLGASDSLSAGSTRVSSVSTPDRHADSIATGAAGLGARSHTDSWGAGVGAVLGGLAGYAYERGACDVIASRCTGWHGAIGGAVIGALVGYAIGRAFTPHEMGNTVAASACLPGDTPDAARLLDVARGMVIADTGAYASARAMYHFPHMTAEAAASRVAVVRAQDVCTRVAAAFRRVVRDSVSTGPVYVIAVGDMYWAYDPAWETARSEFQPYVSFFHDLRVAGMGAA